MIRWQALFGKLGLPAPVKPSPADLIEDAKNAFLAGKAEHATELLKGLIEDNDTEAIGVMANAHYYGVGIPKDYTLATLFFRKASNLGDFYGMTMLGLSYLRGSGIDTDFTQGVALFQKAADAGYRMAQRNLGILYDEGTVLEADPVAARAWMQKAADQEDPLAQWHLGSFWAAGKGGTVDLEKAAFWYEKAAQQDFLDAQRDLGKLYWKGLGVPKDPDKAVFWLRKASLSDDPEALFWMGHAYMDGYGVPKDEDEAIAYWRKTAELSDSPDAPASIGQYFIKSRRYKETPETQAMTLRYLQRGAEDGSQTAQFCYGLLHLHGLIVEKAPQDALHWFTQAAVQGHRMSMIEIARIHAEGLGQPIDYQEALAWLILAADSDTSLDAPQAKLYETVQQQVNDAISPEERAGAHLRAITLRRSLQSDSQ